jgi:DNA-binding transcriptional LysR family regulator
LNHANLVLIIQIDDYHLDMNEIELSAIDLNLLVALDALLTEGSVTRAARRVGVGQSAMSHTLRRLRDLLGDPLFVRVGRKMEPTPRAVALETPLRRVLRDIQQVLRSEPEFDPATSQRTFTLLCPDALGGVVPHLLAVLQRRAPNVQLRLVTPRRDVAEALIDQMADMALTGPHTDVSGVVRRGLGRLEWAVLLRAGHPAATDDLTVEEWLGWPHILIETGNQNPNAVEAALQAGGLQREIGVVLPSFLMVPRIISQTDYFYTMPRALAEPLIEGFDLRLAAPPIALPDVPVAALWPQRLAADPAHRWFRETITEAIAERL